MLSTRVELVGPLFLQTIVHSSVRRRTIAKGPIKDEKPKLLLASFLEGDVTSLDQCDLRDSPVDGWP
ncbi:unnamed protein product [Sphagnum troendelagicum]